MDYRDVAIRAVKTFLETGVTAFLAGLNGIDLFATEQGFWIGLLLSAGAAGISAVWNGLIEPMAKALMDRKETAGKMMK